MTGVEVGFGLGGNVGDLKRAAGRDQCDGTFRGHGVERAFVEPGSEATYGLELVGCRLGGAQDAVGEADQPDVAQQVVQDGQGR